MDRNLYKSDKKLANHGWRAMRRALDREMPEERRRRPVALLWIFALLVPAAGILGWLLFGPGIDTPATVSRQAPVASSPAPAPAEQNKQAANAADKYTRSAKSVAGNDNQAYQLREITPEKAEHYSVLGLAFQTTAPRFSGEPARESDLSNANPVSPRESGAVPVFEPVMNNSGPDASSLNPAPENTLQDIALQNPAGPAETEQTPNPVIAAPIQNPISSALPASTEADTASIAPFFMPVKPIDPLREAKKSDWSFGANAGVSSDTRGDYAGMGAGLSAEWQPLKKWGFRSGVGYQFRQLGAEERPVVSLTAISYVDVTGDKRIAAANNGFQSPSTNQGSTEPSQVYIPIGRLHRVEVPVLAFWQPLSKLRVFGGVAIGNNLYVQAGNRTLNNNVVYTVPDGTSNKNLNREVSEQFRQWDTRLSIGVGFKPARHLELGMFFHKPIPSGRIETPAMDATPGNASVDFMESISGKSSGLNTNGLFNFTASWFF